jgi:hypothetical protein
MLNPMLWHHLRHNHYPPVSPAIDPFVVKAIAMGRVDDEVTLTVGGDERTLLVDGKPVTANQLIEHFHLDIFVDDQEEEHD